MPRIALIVCLLGSLVVASSQRLAHADGAWQPGPDASGPSTLVGYVDTPSADSVLTGGATVAGWVVDSSASGWTGIVRVDVVAGDSGSGTDLGSATIQQPRPDVAAALDNPYWAGAGFSLAVSSGALPAGTDHLSIVAKTAGKGSWTLAVPVQLGAPSTPAPATPAPAASAPGTPTPAMPSPSAQPNPALLASPSPQPSSAAPSMVMSSDQQAFVAQMAALARQYRAAIPVQPSLVVAMGINESGFGVSQLAQNAHNYFGLTAYRAPGPAGTYQTQQGGLLFRAYHNMDECVRDLGGILQEEPYVAQLKAAAPDPSAQARVMVAGGWASDPTWVDKMGNIIRTYGLSRFDS